MRDVAKCSFLSSFSALPFHIYSILTVQRTRIIFEWAALHNRRDSISRQRIYSMPNQFSVEQIAQCKHLESEGSRPLQSTALKASTIIRLMNSIVVLLCPAALLAGSHALFVEQKSRQMRALENTSKASNVIGASNCSEGLRLLCELWTTRCRYLPPFRYPTGQWLLWDNCKKSEDDSSVF